MNEIDYKALFESVPGLYLVLEPNTKYTIMAVSNPYLEATMTKREEILGKGLFEVFPDNPEDPQADGVSNLRSSLQYVLRNKGKHTMAVQKYDIRRPDGSFEERYWNPQNLPVLDGKGGITCIIHRVEDVTDFIRLQSEHEKKEKIADDLRVRISEMEVENFMHLKETQRANQELTKANQELESFTYTVSHDLKSPLRAIGAFAKILEEDYGGVLDSEATRILETIQSNARKMTALIENLLEFSKLNKISINKTKFDMTELLKVVIDEQREHKAEIRLDKLHDVPADKALMAQVFTNLITNAIKYSAKVPKPLIQIGSTADEDKVNYTLKDNGAGFDMKYAGKLFNVFQRLHGEEEFEGTGAGLAIVKRIVERHGGRITATGEPGKGATFSVTLPLEGKA